MTGLCHLNVSFCSLENHNVSLIKQTVTTVDASFKIKGYLKYKNDKEKMNEDKIDENFNPMGVVYQSLSNYLSSGVFSPFSETY